MALLNTSLRSNLIKYLQFEMNHKKRNTQPPSAFESVYRMLETHHRLAGLYLMYRLGLYTVSMIFPHISLWLNFVDSMQIPSIAWRGGHGSMSLKSLRNSKRYLFFSKGSYASEGQNCLLKSHRNICVAVWTQHRSFSRQQSSSVQHQSSVKCPQGCQNIWGEPFFFQMCVYI